MVKKFMGYKGLRLEMDENNNRYASVLVHYRDTNGEFKEEWVTTEGDTTLGAMAMDVAFEVAKKALGEDLLNCRNGNEVVV